MEGLDEWRRLDGKDAMVWRAESGVGGSPGGGTFAGFVASLAMVIVSELGDKTFFIAAVMSLKHRGSVVWCGAMLAMIAMTLLSVLVGYALPGLMSREYTHYAGVVLFAAFGVKLVREGMMMSEGGASDELREVEEELEGCHANSKAIPSVTVSTSCGGGDESESDGEISCAPTKGEKKINICKGETPSSPDKVQFCHSRRGAGETSRGTTDVDREVELKPLKSVPPATTTKSTRPCPAATPSLAPLYATLLTPLGRVKSSIMNTLSLGVLWQTCTLTFLAEWGDRSQIATIALAASKSPLGVVAGGVIGHAFCTGLAVCGGKILASKISEKMVALAGGSLFLVFAIGGLVMGA